MSTINFTVWKLPEVYEYRVHDVTVKSADVHLLNQTTLTFYSQICSVIFQMKCDFEFFFRKYRKKYLKLTA